MPLFFSGKDSAKFKKDQENLLSKEISRQKERALSPVLSPLKKEEISPDDGNIRQQVSLIDFV